MGRLLPVAILLFLCSAPSGGLILRKRSTVEASDQNRLIEALKVIERERRRLAGEYDVSGYESSPTESAWQPEDRADNEHDDNLSTRLDTEFMRRLLNVADINADDVSGREVSSDEVNTTAEQSDAVKGDFDKDTRADTDASPSANEPIVDPEELKSIFQSSDVDGEDDSDDSADPVEKKTLPYQLGGPPAHEKKKRRSGFGEEDADDAVAPSGESAEIERLFEEAANNDALGDVTQLEAEVEARQLDGHREMETEEILPDGTDEITREAFDEQVVPGWNNEPVLSKEWVAEREDINEKPTVVRKRSDSWLDVGENPARQTDENVARPMEDDATRYMAYEDAEIDNLAKALDLATRSQLEKTDKYIPEEIRHLRRAIEYEGTLDRFRQSDEAGADLPFDDVMAGLGQGADYEIPDAGQQFTPDNGFDVNKELNNDITSHDNTDTSRLDDYIAKLLRRFVPKEAEEETVAPRKPTLKEWLEGGTDSPSTDKELETEWHLNPLLRRILEEYKDGRLRKRGQRVSQGTFGQLEDSFVDTPNMERDFAGIDQDSYAQAQLARAYQAEQVERAILSQLSDSESDVCPAVFELTDNCAVARDKGLILDDEALDLCNRHQLCYACGAAHGLTRHNCDEGYLNESNQLCGAERDNPHCATDVIKLYVVMLSKHQPVSRASTPDVCSATCTIDYIIGVANRT